MKKIIALLLSLLMCFSVVTVAFAADETTTTVPSEESTTAPEEGGIELGDFEWLLDLPLWTVKPALKVAKIALKLVKVVFKIGAIFGLKPGDIIERITELIENTQNSQEETTAPETTVAVPATE